MKRKIHRRSGHTLEYVDASNHGQGYVGHIAAHKPCALFFFQDGQLPAILPNLMGQMALFSRHPMDNCGSDTQSFPPMWRLENSNSQGGLLNLLCRKPICTSADIHHPPCDALPICCTLSSSVHQRWGLPTAVKLPLPCADLPWPLYPGCPHQMGGGGGALSREFLKIALSNIPHAGMEFQCGTAFFVPGAWAIAVSSCCAFEF